MSTRSGRSIVWPSPLPNALPEVTSRVIIAQPLGRRLSPGRLRRRPRISRRDPRVNGFEALHDRGRREPLDAFLRTSSKADAQLIIIHQSGHGFGELVFIARWHKKSVFPIHDHIDYSASSSCDHRTTTGHPLQYGSRTGI